MDIMDIFDLSDVDDIISEFDKDEKTPVMGSGILMPTPAIDLGPVSRLCQAPKPGPCYICLKRTDTMFLDRTPMCLNCATLLSLGNY